MNQIDKIKEEYSNLKEQYLLNKSDNLKEELKNKLLELDYATYQEYEEKLRNEFSMTTTLEKEEVRLEKLISFITSKQEEQEQLVNDFRKLTGLTIELSYLKYKDNLKDYRLRLELVRKILLIREDLIKYKEDKVKLDATKRRLNKKEILELLYEFCLIDEINYDSIDVDKIINANEDLNKKKVVIPKKKEVKQEIKKEEKKENKEEIKQPVVEEQPKEEENKVLSSMPKIEKIGTVSPTTMFDSLEKTKEKLQDINIPSNGLDKDNNEVIFDTNEIFEKK